MKTLKLTSLLIVATVLMLPACKKKAEDEPSERQLAQGVADVASVVPASVDTILLVRDITDAVDGIGPLVDRAQAYVGDLSPFEADLRNTLGIDVRHPETLTEIGIKPEGQLLLFEVEGARVAVVSVSDDDKFRDHVTRVLSGAPFSLRAPVETEEQADAKISHFRRQEDAAPAASLISRDGLGIVLLSSSNEPLKVEDFLEDPAESLNDLESFQTASTSLDEYPVLLWGDPEALYEQRPADLTMESMKDQVETMIEYARSFGLGLDIQGNGFRGEFSLGFNESDEINELKQLYLRGDEAPSFARAVTDDSYAIIRLVLDTRESARTIFERLADIDTTAPEAERSQALNAELERDFSQTVAPAFGSHIFITTTRARLLTISSMIRQSDFYSPKAMSESFGLVVSMEINERPPIQFSLDKLIEKGHLEAEKREVEGAAIYDLKESGSDYGSLVLQDRLLTFVPRRQSRELIAQLLGGDDVELIQFHSEEASNLHARTKDGGMALDIDEVLNGPIGNLLGGRVPDQLRSTFNLFDEFWLRWSFQQDTVRAPFSLVLNDAPN